jgi:DNA mismatch endonuclease (patch repair protein)
MPAAASWPCGRWSWGQGNGWRWGGGGEEARVAPTVNILGLVFGDPPTQNLTRMLVAPTPGRSRNMAAIRSRNTAPEMMVRRKLHANGYRYRLHLKSLRGRPDLVFPRYRLAVFVHGCFWHGHSCGMAGKPRVNAEYWTPKIEGNRRRDRRSANHLRRSGWTVITIRECSLERDLRRVESILERLKRNHEQTNSS